MNAWFRHFFRSCISMLMLTCLLCGPLPAKEKSRIRQAPEILRGGEHGVGRMIQAESFSDLGGNQLEFEQFTNENEAVVFAMTSTSCPLSKKYVPTLKSLVEQFSSRGIQFVLVNPVATDDLKEMEKVQKAFGEKIHYLHDPEGSVAGQIGALTTTDVIVCNSSRTVVYHGAVDDQYGFGYSLAAPRKRYLVEALEALLEGQSPSVEATTAPGCQIALENQKELTEEVTYHGRISRLMQRHCVECHREDGVGPFSLESLEEVVAHAPMIREVIDREVMPPWFAAEPKEHSSSLWANDRSLTQQEKRDLIGWIEGDQPEGDPEDAPEPLKFAEEWAMGKPDAVYEFKKPVPVPATGIIPYKYITVNTELKEDKWVEAIEILPGEPSVVHHTLVFVTVPEDAGDNSRAPITEPDGVSYWAIYVPGNGMQYYPPGYARLLPAGARLTFQMHYTTNGTAVKDRTRIGLKFAEQEPEHEVRTASIINHRFKIPPGADNHQLEAEVTIPTDIQVLGYLPHHHLRGKASLYELITRDGKTKTLLDVPRYDFNWQLFYQYAKPIIVNKGDKIRFTAWYDNSPENPANPDPTRTVTWGEQTYDEMHLGYVEYTVLNGKPGEPSGLEIKRRKRKRSNRLPDFEKLDGNSDGEATPEEIKGAIPGIPAKILDRIFERFDSDENGKLNEEEFRTLSKLFK